MSVNTFSKRTEIDLRSIQLRSILVWTAPKWVWTLSQSEPGSIWDRIQIVCLFVRAAGIPRPFMKGNLCLCALHSCVSNCVYISQYFVNCKFYSGLLAGDVWGTRITCSNGRTCGHRGTQAKIVWRSHSVRPYYEVDILVKVRWMEVNYA